MLQTVDFSNFPFLSCQLANVLSVAIAKHIAHQHEAYFGSDATRSEDSSNLLIVQHFSSVLIRKFFPKIPIGLDETPVKFAPKARQLYDDSLKEADIKIKQRFDRCFERLFILEFESCLVKENVSREQLLIRNYKDDSQSQIGPDFEPSPTFKQLCSFGRDLADRITKQI